MLLGAGLDIGSRLASYGLGRLEARAKALDALTAARAEQHAAHLRAIGRSMVDGARKLAEEVYGAADAEIARRREAEGAGVDVLVEFP